MTHQTEFNIILPVPFSFVGLLTSHGWVDLLPNIWIADTKSMQRAEKLSTGKVVVLSLSEICKDNIPQIVVKVDSSSALTDDDLFEIQLKTRDMCRLDEDLSEFYKICTLRGAPWNKITQGLGYMLRSPTFFEDLVKTICTTNVQWGGTKGMVKRLVEYYGEPYHGDESLHTFPTPEAIASSSFDEFHAKVRMGYRSEYAYLLARRVVSGEIDLDALKNSSLPTKELKKELLSIKGVGNYAAANLLMLAGRYDELAVDSIFYTFMSERYFQGQKPTAKEAMTIYDDWGKWKYLAYWFEIWEFYENQSTTKSEQT